MRPSQASAALRRIASLIDQSRQPDRALVAKDLRRVLAALAGRMYMVLTNDSEMHAPKGQPQPFDPGAAVAYLGQSPNNAVTLTRPDGSQVAVWCGAGEDPNNYFYQDLPLEEPDADGGDLTAAEAISEALRP